MSETGNAFVITIFQNGANPMNPIGSFFPELSYRWSSLFVACLFLAGNDMHKLLVKFGILFWQIFPLPSIIFIWLYPDRYAVNNNLMIKEISMEYIMKLFDLL